MTTRSFIRSLLAVVLTLGALAAMVGRAAAAPGDFVLGVGHVDGVDLQVDAGRLVLKVQDDTGLYTTGPVTRDPADVLFHVRPEAERTVPAGLPPAYGFLGPPGTPIWLLPQVQQENPDVVWLGWSSQRALGVTAGSMTLHMVDAEGPGDVKLFQTDFAGLPINKWGSAPDFATSIPLAQNSHVHSNWVFTAAGSYTITFRVDGTTTGGQPISTGDVAYSFQVGALASPDPVPDLSISGLAAGYDVGDPITLTAVQDPPTSRDRYQWFVKAAGAADYAVVPGAVTATYAFTAEAAHDGAQVIVKLYGDDDALVAESAPVTLQVNAPDPDPDPDPVPPLSQTITASLDEADGALLVSVDPNDRQVQLSALELNSAGAFTAAGQLRPVRVIDTRSATPGWNVSGQSSAFTNGTGGTIAATGLGWTPAVAAQGPAQGVVAGTPVEPGAGLATSRTLASAPAGAGRGTATLGAGLDLLAPSETPPGTYTALLTLTAI